MGHIAQWSTSRVSLEDTGCRRWVSACATLPRRLPWMTILNETQKNNKTQHFASDYHTFFRTKQLLGPKMDPLLSSLMQQAV